MTAGLILNALHALGVSMDGPGFFASAPVRTALAVGGGAALVSAVVGVFAVMRGQSFAGHALADASSAGGAASLLVGASPLLGFLVLAAAAALGMELAGSRQMPRERDLATGLVLGAGLGLTALFLYLDVTSTSNTGAAAMIMFGSMFAIPPALAWPALAVGAAALAAAAMLYRPLLLCAVDPELAAVRGVRVRTVGVLYMLVLASAVALSALTVGAILSTALLVGPAAAALRLARRPGSAILLAAALGVGATWAGIALAYDSYYWTPGHGWPVSFFVTVLVFMSYLAAEAVARCRRRGSAAAGVWAAGVPAAGVPAAGAPVAGTSLAGMPEAGPLGARASDARVRGDAVARVGIPADGDARTGA